MNCSRGKYRAINTLTIGRKHELAGVFLVLRGVLGGIVCLLHWDVLILFVVGLGRIMADFCKQTSIELFGADCGDLAHLCDKDEVVDVLCEECGSSTVDDMGVCLGGDLCNHASQVQSLPSQK